MAYTIDKHTYLMYNIIMNDKSEFMTNVILSGINGILAISVDDVSKIIALIGMFVSVLYNIFIIIRAIVRHIRGRHAAKQKDCDCSETIGEAIEEIIDEVKDEQKKL